MTGQRKDQSLTRAMVPIVQVDPAFEGKNGGPGSLVKFNPLSSISSKDLWTVLRVGGIPTNSLHEKGFVSIGCEPCTRAVVPGQHEREGRWWWEDETLKECGLHKGNMDEEVSVALLVFFCLILPFNSPSELQAGTRETKTARTERRKRSVGRKPWRRVCPRAVASRAGGTSRLSRGKKWSGYLVSAVRSMVPLLSGIQSVHKFDVHPPAVELSPPSGHSRGRLVTIWFYNKSTD